MKEVVYDHDADGDMSPAIEEVRSHDADPAEDGDELELNEDDGDEPEPEPEEPAEPEDYAGDDEPEPEERPKRKKNRLQERMDELVRRAKEAERTNADVERRYREAEVRALQAEQFAIKQQTSLVASQYDKAKADFREATELGETDRAADLVETLNDLRHNMRQLEDYGRRLEHTAAQRQAEPAPTGQPEANPAAVAKATAWKQNNPWFGATDPSYAGATGAAYEIDARLLQEGFDPASDDYYAELDRRLSRSLPHLFGKRTQRAERTQRQAVAGVSRGSQSAASKRTVRLTPAQAQMADRLGVPHAEYAKYLD